MRDEEVLNKTDAGREEIQLRTRKLPNALRSILLLVDGQRNVGQLREVMAGLRAPLNALEQLHELGLIAAPRGLAAAAAATIPTAVRPAAAPAPQRPADGGGYPALYTQMTEAVRDHLGMRGYFLQLKIERCTDVTELLALLPDLSNALGKARDVGFANDTEKRLRALAHA